MGLDDDYNVAHELAHLVVSDEGFPMTGSIQKYEGISSALNSMLHDPLVHERLEAYGYRDDIAAEYDQESNESRRQIEAELQPADRAQQLHWILNYASNILDWQQLNRGDAAASEFQQWFDQRFPAIAAEARELVAMINETGYQTPRQMTATLRSILRTYKLREIQLTSSPL